MLSVIYKNRMMKFFINIYIVSIITIAMSSCRKFIDVPPPPTQLAGATVYLSNSTAASAVSGIYQTMFTSCIGGGNYGFSELFGLSADEFKLYPSADEGHNQAYTNNLQSTTNYPIWPQLYNIIYQCNSAIQGITKSAGVSEPLKSQLLGEAKFARAYCYFYLTNIFGDVPIVTSTDYKTNSEVARAPLKDVNQLIHSDLIEAQGLLSDQFVNPDGSVSTNRVRPNKWAVTALLARFYLYQKLWNDADIEATKVISNASFQLDTTLNSCFVANSQEAIWQLEAPNNGANAPDGSFLSGFYYGGIGNVYPIVLSEELINAFEVGDRRQQSWTISTTIDGTTYHFPYKYKLGYTGQPPEEFPVLFRLSEQYLIRAEAKLMKGDFAGSITDIDVIRKRAGLQATTAVNQSEITAAIVKERQVELFTEQGHRWFDLARTNQIDSVMQIVAPSKGGSWETSDRFYPISLTELKANPKLTQTPGY
jgi:starch-binding outer membrane protein, SusD/RagB family